MIAAIIENGIVINRIVVDDLNVFPNLVDGENCSIGDLWDGQQFAKPSEDLSIGQWAITKEEK